MSADLTAEEQDWARMTAVDIAYQMVDQASKLLQATWPEDSCMAEIGRRLATQAKAIYADARHQVVYQAMPDLAAEAVWQRRDRGGVRLSWDMTPVQPTWRPKVFERPTITVSGSNDAAIVGVEIVDDSDEASTAEWLRPPQMDPPPLTRRQKRIQRRQALKKAGVL